MSNANETEDLIKKRIDILKTISILSETDEDALARVANVLQRVTFESDQVVFKKGQQGTSMFIIVEGRVKVHDEDHVFAELGERQIFGEYALLDTEARSASVTCIRRTLFLVLDQHDFYRLMNDRPEVTRSIIRFLTKRLRDHNVLEEKLAESNARLQKAHEQIEKEKERIEQLNKEITLSLERIRRVSMQLEDKNKKITDSINYAKRIQTAILPPHKMIKEAIREAFILYKPRDIVSGDFYWFTIKNEKIFLAAVDCTGHGVPGALMSMTGSMLLNEIVNNNNVVEVDEILLNLHFGVNNFLHQKNSEIQDGMDVAICALDHKRGVIEFAGAKNPLIYVKGGEVFTIKGSKYPIGGTFDYTNRAYDKHVISMEDLTAFYIFSDGYADQFSKDGKKFLKKNFRELLLRVSSMRMDRQHQALDETIVEWMDGADQTDDMLVIGIRC